MPLTIAIIGRPNVGKSTLFNRLAGRKLALVDDTPGVTRDRRKHPAKLYDLELEVVDTAGFEETGVGAPRLGLVGDEDHRLAGLAHHLGEGAVVGQDAGLGVDQEEDQVGFMNGYLGLREHAAGQRGGGSILEAGGVDDVELQVVELRRMDAAVAGDTRRVVDQGQPASGEPVEQRGLADVGPADDGYLESHFVTTPFLGRGSVRRAWWHARARCAASRGRQ